MVRKTRRFSKFSIPFPKTRNKTEKISKNGKVCHKQVFSEIDFSNLAVTLKVIVLRTFVYS